MKLSCELRDASHAGALCRLWYSSMAKLLLSVYKALGSSHSTTNKRICLTMDS